ncbi:hypothetical protein LLG96_09250 [bacterium]|nr:hypothetical protein [bacterium]
MNSRAFGSLGQHPFFFRKPVVTAGLFNGFYKFIVFKRAVKKCLFHTPDNEMYCSVAVKGT